MNLLDKQFDRRSEEKCEELLSKAENQIAALSQYSEFLTQKKYKKAKAAWPELFLFLVIGSVYRGVEVRKVMGTGGKTQQKIANILSVWS